MRDKILSHEPIFCKPEELKKVISEAAQKLNLNEEQFMREVYWQFRYKYDREDIIEYLNDNEMSYTDEEVDKMVDALNDSYDSNASIWENVSRAVWEILIH